MKVYAVRREGFIFYMLIVALILPIVVFSLDIETFSEKPFLLLPLIVPIVFLAWIYFDTYYQIGNGTLKYKSGFLKGTIDIGKINRVIIGKTLWVGMKPTLAKNGLIIKYNRYDEIYIAPESNAEFIHDLLAINKNIEVIE